MSTTSASACFSFVAAPTPAKPPPRIRTRGRGALWVAMAPEVWVEATSRASSPRDEGGSRAGCYRFRVASGEECRHDNRSDRGQAQGGGRRAEDGGRLRDLRHHGRPGQGDDVPFAVQARAAGAARLPDRRRGGGRL